MSQAGGESTPLTTNVHDTALIIEGGGMRASYTSAVIAMFIREGIWFDWVGGISAGSSCTANYLSRDEWRTQHSFVDFVGDPNFGSLRTWVEGKGLFSSEYIYEQTAAPDQALPYDYATYLANPTQFAIAAFEMRSGRTQYWGRDDIHEMHDLLTRVRASSTLPILMPPDEIDGEVFVDGALGGTGGIAIDAARAAGYEKYLVVCTRPRDYVKPPARVSAFYKRAFRKYPAVVNGILQRPRRYNHTREQLFELERQGRAYLFSPTNLGVSNNETNVKKLRQQYALGEAQAGRELDAMRAFLGL
jgi:predicted patatin/cPLA2 family phospholipase